MHKETKVHLIYAFTIILIVSGMLFYEHNQTQATRDLLLSEVIKINQQVKNLQAKDASLEKTLTTISGNVSTLSTDLNQQKSQVTSDLKTLTGELQDVRVESRAQLGVLEDKVSTLKAQNQDFSDVIEKSIPAVISVNTNSGSGSGFIVRSNGYAVTNYHVIAGASAGSAVTSDGQRHAIRIVGFNKDADVALLELTGSGFPTLKWGNSKQITIGESVIAVGNPGGLDFTVTKGIISAKRQDSEENPLIQIDVPINPGNSGGPLINSAGRVIGVNTKKIRGFEGVGFALESNYVENIINEIIEENTPPTS
jgi:S1-C subfamily serine protease